MRVPAASGLVSLIIVMVMTMIIAMVIRRVKKTSHVVKIPFLFT